MIYQGQFLAGSGDELVFTYESGLVLWSDLSTAPQALNIVGHEDFLRAVDTHPARRICVTADNAGVVIIWDLENSTALREYRAPDDRLYDVRFSSSGDYILYGGDAGRIYVRDWQNELDGDPPAYVSGSHGIITDNNGTPDTTSRLIWSLTMNAAETWVANAGTDRTVRRWNFADRITEAQEVFSGHASPVWSVAITPRGDRLMSGSLDASIRQWDPVGALEIGPTLVHGGQVLTIDYAPTQDFIASAGRDGFIKIWESGYAAAAADTVELSIGRRELALRIPDLVSTPGARLEIPVILENREALDLNAPIQMQLTIESPRILAEVVDFPVTDIAAIDATYRHA